MRAHFVNENKKISVVDLEKERGLNKRLIEETDNIKICAVNGDYVRDESPGLNFDQFTDGGHYYVTSYVGYKKHIPKGEIWIDDVFLTKPNDMEGIILHEMVERYQMINFNLSYNRAHEVANKAEKEFRKKAHEGECTEIRNEIYEKFKQKQK
jgi:hypothetical protein